MRENISGIITPYEGDQPFIFISYSHMDTEKVLKIIEYLQAKGCRMWYDRRIKGGKEWSDEIAGHITQCAGFIAFISQNYLASENCQDELSYAKEKRKDRLLVYLEDVELPEGMAMSHNRIQAIHKYRHHSEKDFYAELDETPMIIRNQKCGGVAAVQHPDNYNSSNEKKEEQYIEKIKELRHMAEKNPERESNKSNLAAYCNNLANLWAANRKEEAEKLYREAVGLCQSLLEKNPEREDKKSSLAAYCFNLALLLQKTNRKEEAEKWYREAIGLYQGLLEKNPEDESNKSDLALACSNLARLLEITNRKEEAEKWYREAIGLYQGLLEKNPKDESSKSFLALLRRKLANLLKEMD